MLTNILIRDYTLVTQLELECSSGLTVITGETGAGKSILLGALGLALGDRADAEKIRLGAEKAEILATFDIRKLHFVQKWLSENDLKQNDQKQDNTMDDECILRRVITKDGRSRAYINGRTVTLQQIKALGEKLIDIHSQHEHQSLLKPITHRRLLDEFGGLQKLAAAVRSTFVRWYKADNQLHILQSQTQEINARFQLIRYQVDELDQLALTEDELANLEREQKLLSNLDTIQRGCLQVSDMCTNEDGIVDRLQNAINLLQRLPGKTPALDSAEDLLCQAMINVQESQSDIDSQLSTSGDDATRLPEIESRLSAIYSISRKHRVNPEALFDLHQNLTLEIKGLQTGDEHIDRLEKEAALALEEYSAYAKKLSAARMKAAKKLTKYVNEKLKCLAMAHATFAIDFADIDSPADRHGRESIQFLISTNPGQAPKALSKIASGGELSRISLAIQVVTAQTSTIPTLIFDEVDAGIGGVTGDEVGKLLSELGQTGQVFCVTHLAQVASKAQHHLLVEKSISKAGASSTLTPLKTDAVVHEIARMMGGCVNSQPSIAHAQAMLQNNTVTK